jgi:hypothetical protein
MVSSQIVEQQLKKVGCHYTMWGSSEVAELSSLLMAGEEIAIAVNGYYEGGFGLLVATNFRVLIIDKKPFVLNVEDLRYEMMTEVTYGARLLIAEMRIAIPTRTVYFNSWSMEKLHRAMRYIQQHVLEARDNTGISPTGDWFKTRASEFETNQLKQLRTAEKLSKIAKSAFMGIDELKVKAPSIGHSSSLRGINPYRRHLGGNFRRRLPAFYQ